MLTKIIKLDKIYIECSIYITLIKPPEFLSQINVVSHTKFIFCHYCYKEAKTHRSESDTMPLINNYFRYVLYLDASNAYSFHFMTHLILNNLDSLLFSMYIILSASIVKFARTKLEISIC